MAPVERGAGTVDGFGGRKVLTGAVVLVLLLVATAGRGSGHAAPAPALAPPTAGSAAGALGGWPDSAQANAMIGRGVNVVVPWSYLPPTWAVQTADEAAPAVVAGGFTSVRLFVGFGVTAGPAPDYALDPALLAEVRANVEPFLDRGLTVVLNFDGSIGSIERFGSLWRQIAEELVDLPPNVFFELANEPLWQHTPGQPPDFSPTNVVDAEEWNALVAAALPAIRATNPQRTVVVTSSNLSFPQYMDELRVPLDDDHLIATFHQYQPLDVTGHLGPNPPPWSGTPDEVRAMQQSMHDAVCWSRTTGVPLTMSEFGISLPNDAASRFAWTRAAAGLAEAEGISWQFFVFAGGNMQVYDPGTDTFVPELHDALFPSPDAPQYGPWAACPASPTSTTPSTAAPNGAAVAAPAVTPTFTG